MVEREFRSVIEVKAITMRRNAIFTAILVGLPPSESNGISRTCREMMLYTFPAIAAPCRQFWKWPVRQWAAAGTGG